MIIILHYQSYLLKRKLIQKKYENNKEIIKKEKEIKKIVKKLV